MARKGMLTGLLAVGLPLAGMWAKKYMERKRTKKGSFAGYSFTIKKDE